ncbi:MAG: helix-turn-helix transcriptional regulator [Clostridia bacterium]|nr:helix-turn-helix transcriptional regulator [Clostridia bacterium]
MKLRIKEYREEMQLTQKELAERIGNVQRNISNWENGASEPDCETIVRLAELFEISIDELFGRRDLIFESEKKSGIENIILKEVRELSDGQRYSLLQFLREVNNG